MDEQPVILATLGSDHHRYLERLNRDPALAPVRGILVAQAVTPQARTLAAARGIGCVEVDYDTLRGVEGNALRLF